MSLNANRHGVLMENIGGTWSVIDDFLNELRAINAVDSSLEDMKNCIPLAKAQGEKQGTVSKAPLNPVMPR